MTVHLPLPASGIRQTATHTLLNAAHPAGRDIQGDYTPVIMTNPGFCVCWPHFFAGRGGGLDELRRR